MKAFSGLNVVVGASPNRVLRNVTQAFLSVKGPVPRSWMSPHQNLFACAVACGCLRLGHEVVFA
jgi:hypothetical protein